FSNSFFIAKSAFFQILNSRKYFLSWVLLSFAFLGFYIYVPIVTTPGNDFFFQLAITPPELLLLTILLAFLTGLLVAMQLFIFFRLKKLGMDSAVSGLSGVLSGIVAGLFASVSCAACVNAFLAFLGATTIGILLEARIEVIVLSTLIVLAGIYFASKRITDNCEDCRI
ncbi:MAG: hypothetical protein Q7K42_02405, partial [Candidatus Diapherotrites archaeon]|nr:hypothetical protein [Candidatus Diapherotrites archaeon]